MRLRHIHIPAKPPFVPYATVARLQEHFRRRALEAKDGSGSVPPPTLISFTPEPTFTLGRRQHGTALPPEALARLKAPLQSYAPRSSATQAATYIPEVVESPRGGLTTYHGPGQLVLWPIVDLRSPAHKHFGVRDWACTLEKTTIAVLARLFGLEGFRTDDPGVWLDVEGENRKVAAMGVALRRYVSSLGVAINVDMPGTASGGQLADRTSKGVELSEQGNPWLRFVPCGLEGKGVSSVAGASQNSGSEGEGLQMSSFAQTWAEELADRLGVPGVDKEGGDDVVSLLSSIEEDQPN
jgi:lipoyl(octanoyl) transferase 2